MFLLCDFFIIIFIYFNYINGGEIHIDKIDPTSNNSFSEQYKNNEIYIASQKAFEIRINLITNIKKVIPESKIQEVVTSFEIASSTCIRYMDTVFTTIELFDETKIDFKNEYEKKSYYMLCILKKIVKAYKKDESSFQKMKHFNLYNGVVMNIIGVILLETLNTNSFQEIPYIVYNRYKEILLKLHDIFKKIIENLPSLTPIISSEEIQIHEEFDKLAQYIMEYNDEIKKSADSLIKQYGNKKVDY